MKKIEQAAEDFCKLRNYLNEKRDMQKDGTLRHSLEADTAIDAFIAGWKACKEQMMKNVMETTMIEGSLDNPTFIRRKIIIVNEGEN